MSGDGLVPPSAKKIAAACVLVQFRQKLSVCKLHGAAGLRKALQKRGGFDSLHPLQLIINDLRKSAGKAQEIGSRRAANPRKNKQNSQGFNGKRNEV